MRLLQRSHGEYTLLKSENEVIDGHIPIDDGEESKRWKASRNLLFVFKIAACIVVGFAGTLLFALGIQTSRPSLLASCPNPVTRLEWRALTDIEKKDYLSAVRCLKTVPSRLSANLTLYDDFPWVHALVGGYCEHNSFPQAFSVKTCSCVLVVMLNLTNCSS